MKKIKKGESRGVIDEKANLLAKLQTYAEIMTEIDTIDEFEAYLGEMQSEIYDFLDSEAVPKLQLVK